MHRVNMCRISLFLMALVVGRLCAAADTVDNARDKFDNSSLATIGGCSINWYKMWINTFKDERYIVRTHNNEAFQGRLNIRNDGIKIVEMTYLTNYGKSTREIKWNDIFDIQIAPREKKTKHTYMIYIAAIAAASLYISAIDK